ncbi:MAG: cell division protein ZipA C-terminal FtsZ-binding domain-containing protein [Giesbergeria sp.]|uniref:cell division protein ZipA C-terminal FtsZ-binding domain-containing protein n=1 Tax=Giesbergeria sp. TaxID=2818473 RepID=UPI00261095D0|nr:cell division protein ZipA C-terminal FtsZ-binding domain-containing protein [Giesbergeria sp.]MDD2608514.1 cell division protein ZipA C-terminal FtsZ-binding domain-containing protein [Giesbergeria sp.]
MSNLQISLAVIGAVLLALIVAYNAWTNHRNSPKKPKPTEPGTEAPASALRQEPAFDHLLDQALHGGSVHAQPPAAPASPLAPNSDAADDDAAALPIPAKNPPKASTPAPAAPTAAKPVPPPDRRLSLDKLIDAIATLHCEQAVPGDAVLAALPPTRRVGSKFFAIEGWNDSNQQWEQPVATQRYSRFQAGVQLANRTGALSEIEFSEFVQKVQAFADTLHAAAEFPEMPHEVVRAKSLDNFASQHDAQLTFVLRARQAAWSAGYLQQNASRMGFVPGSMAGRMLLPAPTPGMPPVLILAFDTQAALAEDLEQSAVRDLMLCLDVAQVNRSEQPFNRLREVATVLCRTMDGVLCDQNGQPLPAMAMDPIATDLELLYDQLDSHGLSAGSALARRLFS